MAILDSGALAGGLPLGGAFTGSTLSIALPVDFLVEAALGADPTSDPATWVWTDITRFVKGGIQITRGKPNLGQGQPAQCKFRLNNTDSRFTPWHLQSVYYGQWLRGVPIRVKVNPGTGFVVRFQGALASQPLAWPSGNSSKAEVLVTAAGSLRRLSQGAVLRSPLYRATIVADPTAYWSLEDGADATAAVGTTSNLAVSGDVSFGSVLITGALGAVDTSGGGSLLGPVIGTFSSAGWQIEFSVCSKTAVVGAPGTIIRFLTTTLPGGLPVGLGTDLWDGQPHHVSVNLTQSGGDVVADSYHDGVLFSTSTFTGDTLGTPTNVAVNPDGITGDDMPVIGHIALYATFSNPGARAGAATGYSGELANDRVIRLCGEEGVPVTVTGTSTVAMGPQSRATFVDLLRECETADQGILRDGWTAGVTYLAGAGRYNQAVSMALDVLRRHAKVPLEPIEDDSRTRNDVTASRAGGSSARFVDDDPTHPLSTKRIGVYDDQITVNVADDDLLDQAGWRVHISTIPEMRVPTLPIMPSDTPEIITSWLACDIGARYTLTHTPDQYPGDLDQVLEYYVETIDKVAWTVHLTGSPASAWRVLELDADRWEFDGQNLASSVTTTATTWTVASPILPVMVTTAAIPADFPYYIQCEGEVVQVTATADAASDAFGRTVSNGWGTADTGGAWTTAGGVAGDYAVAAGVGTITINSVNVSRKLTLAANVADSRQYITVLTSALATGAALRCGAMARYADTSNYYFAQLSFETDQTIVVRVAKNVAGVGTTIATGLTTMTHTVGLRYRLRFDVVGTALRARAWLDGTTEPRTWNVETTDSALTAVDDVGAYTVAVTGNTNVAPVISFDDYRLISPQTVTVVRSINGLVKVHPAGALIALWPSTPLAL